MCIRDQYDAQRDLENYLQETGRKYGKMGTKQHNQPEFEYTIGYSIRGMYFEDRIMARNKRQAVDKITTQLCRSGMVCSEQPHFVSVWYGDHGPPPEDEREWNEQV